MLHVVDGPGGQTLLAGPANPDPSGDPLVDSDFRDAFELKVVNVKFSAVPGDIISDDQDDIDNWRHLAGVLRDFYRVNVKVAVRWIFDTEEGHDFRTNDKEGSCIWTSKLKANPPGQRSRVRSALLCLLRSTESSKRVWIWEGALSHEPAVQEGEEDY